jgi:lipopolysaccharide biosynthesis glycosyltransferase
MRQDDLVSKFLELSKERLFFGDQDILNIVCKDNIKFLELKYNVLVKYRFVNHKQDHYNDFISKYFQVSEIHEAIDAPVMIHYAQPTKPWQCRYVYKGDIWYGYIRKNISKDIYSKYILPYINSHKADNKIVRKLFIHRLLYKAGILKVLLNLQHKL